MAVRRPEYQTYQHWHSRDFHFKLSAFPSDCLVGLALVSWSGWASTLGSNQPAAERPESPDLLFFLLSITTDVTPIIMSSIKTTTVTTIKTMTANSGMGLVAVLSDTERACHLIFLPNTHLSFRVFYCLFFWHAKTFITALYFPWWQSNSSFGQP